MRHYVASDLKEWRRLTPRKFILRVDRMVEELERVGRPVYPKDVDVTHSGLTSLHDKEVRMLESSSSWPT